MKPLVFLTLAGPAILLCFFVQHPASEWVFALSAMSFPVALIALGGSRRGELGRLRLPLAALVVLLGGSTVGILALAGTNPRGPMGYPVATYLLLAGIWLAPLVVTAWGYAHTFSESGIDERLLERLERSKR